MKYRAGKIKKEHSVIEKLWPVLETIAESDLITSIIPGPISPLNSRGFELTFQRYTDTGLRLLAKNGSAVQEVYLVAGNKEGALTWLADRKMVRRPPELNKSKSGTTSAVRQPPHVTLVLPSDMACERCGRLMQAGTRAVRMGRKDYYYVHVRCAK